MSATVSHETVATGAVSNGRKAYWTEAEIITLRRLRLDLGWSTRRIAEYLDRGHPAVRTKLARLEINIQGPRKKSSTPTACSEGDLPA